MRYRTLLFCSSILTFAFTACNGDDDDDDAGVSHGGASATSGGSSHSSGGNGAGEAGATAQAGATTVPSHGGATSHGGVTSSGGVTSHGGVTSSGGVGAGEAGSPTSEGGSAGAGVIPSEGGAAGSGVATLPTLDGKPPLVIAHRGFPGLYPEETEPAYNGAADAGADSLEEDLHLTKDCVLVARHNPWLSDNTTIATVAANNATVAARKRTVPGRLVDVKYDVATYGGPAQYLTDLTDPEDPKSVLKSLVVDGEDHTGDWSITDFTLAEVKQWIRGTTYDAANERPSNLNGLYPVLTMQEIIDIARAQSAITGRKISVYPEAKNPYWNNQQAKANGCGSGDHPFEDAIVQLINDNGLNSKDAPIYVQSFDPDSLKYMRSVGLETKLVQLVDGNDVNYQTGEMIYQQPDAYNFVDGRPYSWTLAGDPRYFGEMLTPAGLAEVATYADGIGPWKPQLMRLKVTPYITGAGLANVNDITPTDLIHDAHAAGLFVHTYTFRNEQKYLAGGYHGNPSSEYLKFFQAGVDGVFSDFSKTAFVARALFLSEAGH